jgi:putative ABC transport system permease protein
MSAPMLRNFSSKFVSDESLRLVLDTFRENKIRFLFIALGMMVGTACVILVVTIGMTGKQYAVRQIESIGTNMIDAEYQSGGEDSNPDRLTIDDLYAVRQKVMGLTAASPVLQVDNRIPIGQGKERDIRILGVFPEYRSLRNLRVLSGRFFDANDEQVRNKTAVLQQKLAQQLYGSASSATGNIIKLNALPFTVIGTFEERVDTFGQSEVTENSVLIPYSVARYFSDNPDVEQIYFSATDASAVVPATKQIREVIQARHRPESSYIVQNLTSLIGLANRTGNALTLVLLLIAAVTLLVSGIGIMNIMLATVNSRIPEIGMRKALGATTAHIRRQFLAEAVLISLIGGFGGTVIGLLLPFSVRFLTHYRIPISGFSALIAVLISGIVGMIFGTLPATRAARMDPVQSLRHE